MTRYGKAVLRLGVDLDLMRDTGIGERLLEPHLLFGWKARVDLGGAHVDAGTHLRSEPVGTIGFVGRERSAVERCSNDNPIGKRSSRAERIATTHAIAQGSDAVSLYQRMLVQPRDHQARVAHHHRLIDGCNHALESLALRAFRGDDIRREWREWCAVVEIRKGDHVAVRGQALSHAGQFGPDAKRIHVEQDRRPRAGARLGREDMQIQDAIVRLQIDPFDTHRATLSHDTKATRTKAWKVLTRWR